MRKGSGAESLNRFLTTLSTASSTTLSSTSSRCQAGTPGRSPVIEHLRIFVEQYKRFGPQAMCDGILARL
jgi:hypothetical protein